MSQFFSIILIAADVLLKKANPVLEKVDRLYIK